MHLITGPACSATAKSVSASAAPPNQRFLCGCPCTIQVPQAAPARPRPSPSAAPGMRSAGSDTEAGISEEDEDAGVQEQQQPGRLDMPARLQARLLQQAAGRAPSSSGRDRGGDEGVELGALEAEFQRSLRAEVAATESQQQHDPERMDLSARAARGPGGQRGRGSHIAISMDDMSDGLVDAINKLLGTAGDPGINLMREEVATQKLAEKTKERMRKDIMRYMGFMQHMRGAHPAALGLSAYADFTSFFKFIEYLLNERQVAVTEAKKHTSLAIKVVDFCAARVRQMNRGDPSAGKNYKVAASQLGRLLKELTRLATREKGATIPKEVLLPTAVEAMCWIEFVVDGALARLTAWERAKESVMPFELAVAVRDAAMLALTVGHVGLTVRIHSVRTIYAPEFASRRCPFPGCMLPGCTGNRLLMLTPAQQVSAGGRASTSAAGAAVPAAETELRIEVSHHKNTCRGIFSPPITLKSQKLIKLLTSWCSVGRKALVRRVSRARPSWQDPCTLFITERGAFFHGLSSW